MIALRKNCQVLLTFSASCISQSLGLTKSSNSSSGAPTADSSAFGVGSADPRIEDEGVDDRASAVEEEEEVAVEEFRGFGRLSPIPKE